MIVVSTDCKTCQLLQINIRSGPEEETLSLIHVIHQTSLENSAVQLQNMYMLTLSSQIYLTVCIMNPLLTWHKDSMHSKRVVLALPLMRSMITWVVHWWLISYVCPPDGYQNLINTRIQHRHKDDYFTCICSFPSVCNSVDCVTAISHSFTLLLYDFLEKDEPEPNQHMQSSLFHYIVEVQHPAAGDLFFCY